MSSAATAGARSRYFAAHRPSLRLDDTAPYDIDVAGLADYADVLIGELDANVAIAPERLRPRLVVRPLDPGDNGSQREER